jgi:hypothetical protein
MDVLGHDDVSHNHEPVTLASLFENVNEAVAASGGAEKRQSSIAGTGDKVQVMRAVRAMQSARHHTHGTDSISTRPCKKRKDGAPTFRIGKELKKKNKGGPPALSVSLSLSNNDEAHGHCLDDYSLDIVVGDLGLLVHSFATEFAGIRGVREGLGFSALDVSSFSFLVAHSPPIRRIVGGT